MVVRDPLVAHVVRTARAAWPAGARLVVACSGGADSVALLHLLHAAAGRAELALVVASVDHGLRGAAGARDVAAVAAHAASLGLPFRALAADVPAERAAHGGSVESAARVARYRELAAAACTDRAEAIAVAHTRDDQAETVWLRLRRAGSPAGVAAMRPLAPVPLPGTGLRLWRPLLPIPRARLRRWLRARGIAWREDATNRDVRLARNRVRHRALPAARTVLGTGLDADLARLAASAARLADLGPALSGPAAAAAGGGGAAPVTVPLAAASDLGEAAAADLLRALVTKAGGEPRALRAHHYAAWRDLARGRVASANLPRGLVARARAGFLTLRRPRPGAPVRAT